MTEQNSGPGTKPGAGDGPAHTPDGAAAAEVDRLKSRVAELEHRWHTAAADLDNFRKRTIRDAERSRELERARVAREWLPVLDNLDAALQHNGPDPDPVLDGVRAVREQAAAVLARLGYPQRGDEQGVAFDPARHEALSTVATGEFAPGTIVATVRTGYGDGDHQLRPPGVVVAAPETG